MCVCTCVETDKIPVHVHVHVHIQFSPILQTESNHIKFNPMLTHYHIYTYSLGNTYFNSYHTVIFHHYAHLLYHLTGGCLLFLSSLLHVCSFLGSVAILRSFCEGTFSGGASLIWGSHSPGGRTVTLSRNSSIPARRSPLLRALYATSWNTWRKIIVQ